MGPETAAAICSGILGVSGVIVAALVTTRKRDEDSKEEVRETAVCLQHSGVATSLTRLEKDITEIKTDVKSINAYITRIVQED